MPTLRIQDFPETLYDELQDLASASHRSVGQQIIVAVERMIHGSEDTVARKPIMQTQDTLPDAATRLKRRREILERAQERRNRLKTDSLPSPVELTREARAERNRDFAALLESI